MRKLRFLTLVAVFPLVFLSCKDTKKEQEQVEVAVKTIDSVETAIRNSAEHLEEVSEDVKTAVRELDSI